jgi:glycosyltransferase involved in cell wall biosynthesis
MKFAVITATYQRSNGSSPEVVTRAINSLKEQKHQDFKLFLIGDHYENDKEFQSFKKLLPKDKIYLKNLPFSPERKKYKNPSKELWACGGTSAINRGIDIALEQGFTHITLLDHDDIWYPNHLELLNKAIEVTNSPFIITKGVYTNPHKHTAILPRECDYKDLSVNLNSYYQLTPEIKAYPFIPVQCRFMKLSVCMDISRIKLRFRDVFHETEKIEAGDADLWNRIGKLMHSSIEKEQIELKKITEIISHKPPQLDLGIFIEEVTCSNFEEGYAQTNA